MAGLYYANLPGITKPEKLMKKVYEQLGVFYKFLTKTKYYMESWEAVMRLSWEEFMIEEKNETRNDSKGKGIWIQLKEPKDRPNEPDITFRSFCDENIQEVYEYDFQFDEEKQEGIKKQIKSLFSKGIKDKAIKILDRAPKEERLLLERLPKGNSLLLRPNTLTLLRQIEALKRLQDAPFAEHLPLLRLMEAEDQIRWPDVTPTQIEKWMLLTDERRPGTEEQQRFVSMAMGSPDFSFLEGPPGSGKTTAICELILQMLKENKRVLLCASTHVAVDNVLERLMDESKNQYRDLVIPIRIGDQKNCSEKARPWQLDRFVETERDRLRKALERCSPRTTSQSLFLEKLRQGKTMIETMVLESANLVCGTTIGILQHPDIKRNKSMEKLFDVLIIDEASKTTFQEFLVPAMYAKRWVFVGDTKQLSPYIEDDAIATNIKSVLPSEKEYLPHVCLNVFLTDPKQRSISVVSIESEEERLAYQEQANEKQIPFKDITQEGDKNLWAAPLIIGSIDDLERYESNMPLDTSRLHAPKEKLHQLRRQINAWTHIIHPSKRGKNLQKEEELEWAREVAWRLCRLYELRFSSNTKPKPENNQNQNNQEEKRPIRSKAQEKLERDISKLLPAKELADIEGEMERIKCVALPSILESLQEGFSREPDASKRCALSQGLPEEALKQRHILLSYQHRMHPDIAYFSHKYVYNEKALISSENMVREREWSYSKYTKRNVWIDQTGEFDKRWNQNEKEVTALLEELKHFDGWASCHPRDDWQPWEVAILAFYRGQEKAVRKRLQEWTGQRHKTRDFGRGMKDRPYMVISLCTVDRFQGHEADVVLITLANDHPTNFLQSPNRLNVALTRARYQRILIGDRKKMKRSSDTLLGKLANEEGWDTTL